MAMRAGKAFLLALGCLCAASAARADDTALRWQREDARTYREKFLAIDRSFSPAARAQAEARLSRIENAAAPLSPAQFAVEMCRITALADNGHTQCMPAGAGRSVCERYQALVTEDAPWCKVSEPDFAVDDFDSVAITFTPFGTGFHVTRVAAEHADLLGARLLAVDGRSVASMGEVLRTFSGGTVAYRDVTAASVLASPVQLHAVALADRPDAATYELVLASGAHVKRRFAVPTATDTINWQQIPSPERMPWSLAEPQQMFRFRDAPQIDSLVVQLRSILDTEAESVVAFLDRAEQRRAELGRRNIVLDLRANGGGNLLLAREFMTAWPQRVPGKFYALTSRNTFSAAIATLSYLKQAGGDRVIIVGEPVGDRQMFFSDGLPVQLPHSGLFYLPAVLRMDYADGCRKYDDCFEAVAQPGGPAAPALLRVPPQLRRMPLSVPSLAPDVSAPWTVESWLRGMDPAIEAVAVLQSQAASR